MSFSRRTFLARCGWTPVAFLPASLRNLAFGRGAALPAPVPPEYRFTPHYRAKSPLEPAFRNVAPGFDEFPEEKIAAQIERILRGWTAGLCRTPSEVGVIRNCLAPELSATPLETSSEKLVRSDGGLEIYRSAASPGPALNREQFAEELRRFFTYFSSLLAAEFQVTSILVSTNYAGSLALTVIQTRIRYDLVGARRDFYRGERTGQWDLEWVGDSGEGLLIRRWQAIDETRSRTKDPVFVDISAEALGRNSSYREQLAHGAEYWRSVLDGACGIDVYGNNGIAVGDVDGDGFDDLYICQPAGLPNRLYRNRGDGTFEDVTEAAGVGVLDDTPCALFADLDNDGHEDLVVVRAGGPLLFVNQGNGTFELNPDAFRFAQAPQGSFTGAAIADYNRDGLLDVYFCLYSYYQGLDQYRFPTPYYDAENGPSNFLMRNNGDQTFTDVTAASGMSRNNHRFSFACGWCDYNSDGWPDLYVANDFGRKNLYRNNGDGTFTDVAREAGVEDVGAGMSVCWCDFDNDGLQDLYVADMWSAAGERVSAAAAFMKGAPESVRGLYRKHARGNSLFRQEPGARFADASAAAGVELGRWAWSSDAWDFDHDGYPDLYIANGMISGPNRADLSSFFWRQVVAKSPFEATTSHEYEQGWNAINELIRSDSTWSGYERNVFYANNRDGTFSDISGAAGLDFIEDSRAFALADFDHDGRLEVFLKNRSGPQLRILRNQMRRLGNSISFRLRGHKSNRDAIGAMLTVEAGALRQVKFLQAGSGFLSQHTKEVFFGLGKADGPVRATIRWPSGLTQHFDGLPVGHRITIEEGAPQFRSEVFRASRADRSPADHAPLAITPSPATPALPALIATWLVAPLAAPDFALPDLRGHTRTLAEFRGRPLLVNFWSLRAPACRAVLTALEASYRRWNSAGLAVATLNVDGAAEAARVRAYASDNHLSLPVLLASDDVAGIYNIVYRYLFDRRRDLPLPTSFLINAEGAIAKVYQGPLDPERVTADVRRIPHTAAERLQAGLPFPGTWYGGPFERNEFTYGVAFFQRGYLDQAVESFRRVVRSNPTNADAYYNLGTIYLKEQRSAEARAALERVVQIKSEYPDAWNNLGMLAAEAGRGDEAIQNFKRAIEQNPRYSIAYQNLGNLYRSEQRWADAEQALERAHDLAPDDPDVNYSLGMLFAHENQSDRAQTYLERAIALRPDYPEALNNLGVLYLRTERVAEAIRTFERCTQVSPSFDQAYMNLARVYAAEGERSKAEDVLRALLRQHPNHAQARQALEQLTHP